MTEMTFKKYLEPFYTLDRVALASILETARKELDRPLSLQDVANRIGVFKGTVNNYEKDGLFLKNHNFRSSVNCIKLIRLTLSIKLPFLIEIRFFQNVTSC